LTGDGVAWRSLARAVVRVAVLWALEASRPVLQHGYGLLDGLLVLLRHLHLVVGPAGSDEQQPQIAGGPACLDGDVTSALPSRGGGPSRHVLHLATDGRRDAVAPAAKITRDRVVAQALKVIAQEGVGMLTMRTLAARLGVVPGALYRHGRG
jgi:Bacterial regulatory proteins, tetR family